MKIQRFITRKFVPAQREKKKFSRKSLQALRKGLVNSMKKLLLILMVFILVLSNGTLVSANSNVPYQTYNYDYWEDVYYTPAAYIPCGSISGTDLGAGALTNPQDIFVADDGRVYIADTGNNRIIVLKSDMTLERVIDTFDNNGTPDTFKNPTGLCITSDNEIYIADTDNLRVVALMEDGSLLKLIQNPTSEVLEDDLVFIPLKVSVDYADRVYVIAKNMFQGIMAFDESGSFTGFSGTIRVTISTYGKIWRRLSTKEQRQGQLQFIPTEFTGVDMAPDGFVYATNVDTEGMQSVRRLNPKGQDVIQKKKNGTLSGDLDSAMSGEYAGASRIIDVVYRGSGIYSIVDYTRGRIFTYDHEGNLLYVFGGRGSQEGTFKSPVAIEAKDDKILVLDAYRGEIMIFNATEYGKLINEAVAMRYDGDEAAAVKVWQEVLKLDSNFELAYVGIGKSYLASGENKKAMEYLKLGMDREYYSIAFKRYRDDILKQNLGYILTGGLIVVIALIIRKIHHTSQRGGLMKLSRKEKLFYPFYVISHPFGGFYEVRHRNKGSISVALLLIFLFGLSFSLNRRYAGFVVNMINPRSVDTRTEIIGVFLAVLLFATANWSITCLMEGEGRFRDILTTIGYSMLPMVLAYVPMTFLSWFVAADEEGIYYIFMYASVIYFVILLMIGIMTIHNFSFGKTLITLVLTFIALFIIIFIILLMISLINQVWLFLESVYTELILRA